MSVKPKLWTGKVNRFSYFLMVASIRSVNNECVPSYAVVLAMWNASGYGAYVSILVSRNPWLSISRIWL